MFPVHWWDYVRSPPQQEMNRVRGVPYDGEGPAVGCECGSLWLHGKMF